MASPITEPEYVRIVELLGEGLSRHAVARTVGRSPSAVQRIAVAEGFAASEAARARTANATTARRSFCAERRAEHAAAMQDEIRRLLELLDAPTVVYNFGGRDNTYAEHTLPRPDAAAIGRLVDAICNLQRTVLAIDKQDNRDHATLSAFDDFLATMIGPTP